MIKVAIIGKIHNVGLNIQRESNIEILEIYDFSKK